MARQKSLDGLAPASHPEVDAAMEAYQASKKKHKRATDDLKQKKATLISAAQEAKIKHAYKNQDTGQILTISDETKVKVSDGKKDSEEDEDEDESEDEESPTH